MKKKICFLLVIILIIFLSLTSAASLVDNPIEVLQGKEITYYLHVRYDGVDREGIESSDTVTSSIFSNYIYVEDRIPEGLTDISIVQTEDGSIGAVDGNGDLCAGEVVGGVDGINVDTTNNVVSFKVYGLKAGCTLSVGINATTPTIAAGTRKDFFNMATATEGIQTAISNIVHIWMGKASVEVYKVDYQYVGYIPIGATPLPGTMSYSAGNTVRVMGPGVAEGYTFDGWHLGSIDGTLQGDTFVMPSSTVTLYGQFNKIDESQKKKVTYEIVGDLVPENYVVPKERTYFKDTIVNMDTLKKGDVFNGYRFLGWNIVNNGDIGITNDQNGIPRDFVMPDRDVVIQGSWELVKYNVVYKFHNTTVPPNADSLLPETKSYRPGTNVTLEGKPVAEGYKFLGWYKESSFTMPEKDIVIYGEWQEEAGFFAPTISKNIINEKQLYQPGDSVMFEIVVTNTADYPINEIYVVENNEKSKFILGSGYTFEEGDGIALIDRLEAGEAITLYAKYEVDTTDIGKIVNEVEILGAIADGNYIFDSTGNYKAEDDFTIRPKIKICKTVELLNYNTKFQFEVIGEKDDEVMFNTWVSLDANSCSTIYVDPGTYSVNEIIPQEYILESVNGAITANGDSFEVLPGQAYEIGFTNKMKIMPYYHSFGRIENTIG